MSDKFPKRKMLRLKEYDYSKEGMYFITICTQNRKNLFWNDDDNIDRQCRGGACSARIPKLNYLGEICENELIKLEQKYINVELGEFIIMPNHVHMIIEINKNSIRVQSCNGRNHAVKFFKEKFFMRSS